MLGYNGLKVFISGKITGVPDYKEKFYRAAHRLREAGCIVLNPATLPIGLEYCDYARICTAMIEAADVLMLLPGYEKSPGALMEIDYAGYIGKGIRYFNDFDKEHPDCERPCYDGDDPNW